MKVVGYTEEAYTSAAGRDTIFLAYNMHLFSNIQLLEIEICIISEAIAVIW